MEKLITPIYFDTNVFIYALEGHEEYKTVLAQIFTQVAEENLSTITSEISLAECLVKPVKDNNEAAIAAYKKHIASNSLLNVISIDRNILIESASLRCELGLKLPDAIHMATAVAKDCKTFITNDRKLKTPEGMQQVYLKDLL